MARKKFGISPSVNKALTQTIQMAEAENSNFMNTEILIDRIKLDPENPRKHKITIQDINEGISKKDPDFKEKQSEYEGLLLLATSIENEGLLHPIIVIEQENNFKLVAGERRYLASMIAKRKVIEARVFKKRPKPFDLKVIQWSENQARKDLSLYKKLMNVKAIADAFELENQVSVTAIKLAEILGVSRQQAQFYKAILSNPELLQFIKAGQIATMEVARQLTNENSEQISAFLENSVAIQKPARKVMVKDKSMGKGRKRSSVSLGATKNVAVVKTITETMLTIETLNKYAPDFQSTDWACFTESTKAFQKLIKILEKESGALVP